jgi:hypothetical protein
LGGQKRVGEGRGEQGGGRRGTRKIGDNEEREEKEGEGEGRNLSWPSGRGKGAPKSVESKCAVDLKMESHSGS